LTPANGMRIVTERGWAGVIAIAYAVLRQRRLPSALPYLTTLADAALVTALVVVSGGPRNTLVLLFLLIVAPRLCGCSFGSCIGPLLPALWASACSA